MYFRDKDIKEQYYSKLKKRERTRNGARDKGKASLATVYSVGCRLLYWDAWKKLARRLGTQGRRMVTMNGPTTCDS